MKARQVKEWFNETFFEEQDGKLIPKKEVVIAQKMISSVGAIDLPAMRITKDNTYAEVFHELYAYLDESGAEISKPPETAVPKSAGKIEDPELGHLINVDVVVYRRKQYRVEHYVKGKEESYKVIRLEDQQIIPAEKKTYQHAINLFKKLV